MKGVNRRTIISLLVFLIPCSFGGGIIPTTLGKCSLPEGFAYQVVLDGDIAYVADGAGGLRIVDISNPAKPTLLGSCDTGGNTVGVAVGKNLSGGLMEPRYVYVADAVTGMNTIEVTDLTNPKRVGGWYIGGRPMGITTWGPYVFELLDNGVQRFNVDDPKNPFGYGAFFLSGFSTSICAATDRIYVGDGAFDPQTLKAVPGPVVSGPLAVSGSRIYWDLGYELGIADISDPDAPKYLGGWSVSDWGWAKCRSFAVDGNRVFTFLSGNNGDQLVIYDAANPTNVVAVGSRPVTFGAIAIRGNLAYLRSRNFTYMPSDGLEIVDIGRADESEVRLHPARTRTGEFHVIGSGNIGTIGRLLRSNDLINWTTWKDVTFDTTTLDIVDDLPASERTFISFVSGQ